jgi:hypothetical protein
MTDLRRHIADCLAALERFGRVSEFDRMQALGTWENLASNKERPVTSALHSGPFGQKTAFKPDLSRVVILGDPFIGCAPVEWLAAAAPGLGHSRKKALKVGHGSPFGFLGCATMPAPSITPGRVIWPWTITATFSAPSSAMVARALR